MPPRRTRRQPGSTADQARKLRIRMYRQGLGDCFLLTFDPAGQPVHVLIDFGTLGSSLGQSMKAVATDIIQSTRGHLHLLVATHEHKDHVSGFPQLKTASDEGRLQIDRVWMAWTENPRNARAEELRNKKAAFRDDLQLALATARPSAKDPLALAIEELLQFAGDPDRLGAADFAETVDAAMDAVRTGLGFEADYLSPGKLLEPDWLPGFRFYILGPPTEDRFLGVLGEHGDSRIYELQARLRADVATPPAGAARQEIPFDLRFQHLAQDSPFLEEYVRPDLAWRRIDQNWLNSAALLALQLDSLTNNTSLALAIERVADEKVFLFPADAQLGNWLSWHEPDMHWEVPGPGGTRRRVTVEDLLQRTVSYKVGHHGSHNATAKDLGLEKMRHSDELTALIPVDRTIALSRNPKGTWKMPAKTLYRTLLEKCQGRVLRADLGWAAPPPAGAEDEQIFADLFQPAALAARWAAAQRRAEERGDVQIEDLHIDVTL